MLQIKDIYTYTKDHTTPMLSNFTSSAGGNLDFWKPYKDNYSYFDRIFMKKYRSWYPMDQEGEIDDIATDFANDVKSWLMINDKRYSELYRIQTIPDDEKYSLTDNVFEHEVVETEFGKVVTFNKGEQEIKDEGSTTYAEYTDTQDNSRTTGATGKTITDSTSAYNTGTFTAVDKTEEDDESREDTEDLSTTHGAHTDTNGNTRTDGAREDSTEDSGTETVTRDRAGNIGVKDVPQIFMDQRDFWVDFSFYEIIFSEITRELLRGGVY